MHWLAHEFCDDEHPLSEQICANLFFLIAGVNYDQLNVTMLSFYLDHLPAGSSTQTFVHYAQLYLNKDNFVRYDYGEEGNIDHYGTPSPPAFDLTKVCEQQTPCDCK